GKMPLDLHRQTERLHRQADGDSGAADLLTQIAGLDLAALADEDRRDIGAHRADIIRHGLRKQRPGILTGGPDPRVAKLGRPALLCGAIDHRAIPGPVGGDDRGARDLDFLLFERGGHSAASNMCEMREETFWRRHGAECAMTSPMMRMAGPPSTCSTSAGN